MEKDTLAKLEYKSLIINFASQKLDELFFNKILIT